MELIEIPSTLAHKLHITPFTGMHIQTFLCLTYVCSSTCSTKVFFTLKLKYTRTLYLLPWFLQLFEKLIVAWKTNSLDEYGLDGLLPESSPLAKEDLIAGEPEPFQDSMLKGIKFLQHRVERIGRTDDRINRVRERKKRGEICKPRFLKTLNCRSLRASGPSEPRPTEPFTASTS